MKEKKIRIYTMTHKAFNPPSDSLYVPLQVGAACNEDLGYLRDDSGENISDLNGYYSELTGFYWIWKNVKDLDYVGTCHYRRFLINENNQVYNEENYLEMLEEYDLITTRQVHLNNSYHYGFGANHNIHALDQCGEVIREKYPEYYDNFCQLVNGPDTYFGNMIVTSKEIFDEYASFLFGIFFEVQKSIDMETDKDAYHRRVFGFISEFLLGVFVKTKGLKVKECRVAILGEKAENRQIKIRLAEFLKKKDILGAKQYFLAEHEKRPDILMEASDINGELHLAMQIISTADFEMRMLGKSFLDEESDLEKLFMIFQQLNEKVARLSNVKADTERGYLLYGKGEAVGDIASEAKLSPLISDIAKDIAVKVFPGPEEEKPRIRAALNEANVH